MFKIRQLPKKLKRSLFLPCVCSWMILTVFVSGGTQSMKVMLKTFCRWLPWHRTFCFKLTWKSMRKVASLALLYLTAHHIMASINSYFHLLPAKWRNESKKYAANSSIQYCGRHSPAFITADANMKRFHRIPLCHASHNAELYLTYVTSFHLHHGIPFYSTAQFFGINLPPSFYIYFPIFSTR